jgi:hypothetical protein
LQCPQISNLRRGGSEKYLENYWVEATWFDVPLVDVLLLHGLVVDELLLHGLLVDDLLVAIIFMGDQTKRLSLSSADTETVTISANNTSCLTSPKPGHHIASVDWTEADFFFCERNPKNQARQRGFL